MFVHRCENALRWPQVPVEQQLCRTGRAPCQGKETIDASGHVVCPGFTDMHHYNAGVPFGVKLALRDGVTTKDDDRFFVQFDEESRYRQYENINEGI
jgi:predicted amidohydrolase YtcJ